MNHRVIFIQELTVNSLLKIATFAILCLFVAGCSGEPTYAKPTGSGTKNVKEMIGGKNPQGVSVDKY